MLIQIAVIISIVAQVIAAILAINLTRSAKYNFSWILLIIALLLMAFRRVVDFFPLIYRDITEQMMMITTWIGVLTSLTIIVAIAYIRKIFNMIRHSEASRLVIERKVLDTMIRTEENERKRFAKDLHDGLGPLLSNLKMSVSALENMENKVEMRDILENMKSITDESLSSIREIANNLSPHILENFGILKAVEDFSQKIRINCDIVINIESNIRGKRYSYNTEIILYRVITELLNNTLKHAQAKRIDLSVLEDSGKLILFYSDDGKGLELTQDESWQGMGLSNIVSRIKSLQGTTQFFSNTGEGFRVKIVCPSK